MTKKFAVVAVKIKLDCIGDLTKRAAAQFEPILSYQTGCVTFPHLKDEKNLFVWK